ncbi:hypothetical protein G4B88_002816 [Cannabis sativa]|uniref:Cystatin domain-containing protein n=1 Tax=Cannabis sativa TaxID=3483 RepID=A0A7J6ED36_CANSA|nr:hypothetical protein G4B88_002816 [Cannabis sativa]
MTFFLRSSLASSSSSLSVLSTLTNNNYNKKKKKKKEKRIAISTTAITKPPHHDNDNDHDDLMITNNETITTNKSSTETTITHEEEEKKKKKKNKKRRRSVSPVIIMHARYPNPNPNPTPEIQVKYIDTGFYTPPHLRDVLEKHYRQEEFYEGFYLDPLPEELLKLKPHLLKPASVDDPLIQELAKWAIQQYNAENDKGEKLEFQRIVRVNKTTQSPSRKYYVTVGVLGAWHRYYEAKISYHTKFISPGRCVPTKTLHFCRYARHYPMVY